MNLPTILNFPYTDITVNAVNDTAYALHIFIHLVGLTRFGPNNLHIRYLCVSCPNATTRGNATGLSVLTSFVLPIRAFSFQISD